MTNYRITYEDEGSNTRTIDLLPGDDGVQIEWSTELNRNITSTGRYENIVQNTLRFIEFDCYFKEAGFHKLETFMSFAQQGIPFTFTKDSSRGTIIDLAAAATAGDTALTTTATSDFTAGDFIILRSVDGSTWDVCEVASVVATTINLVEEIQHDYAIGALANWYFYFDSILLLDEKFNPKQRGDFWNHKFNCVENRNGA